MLFRTAWTNEEKRYDIYNTTYGNRDYLFDKNTIPMGGGNGGFGYEIPPEALTDERFANMIREAEKYLGYPYVWGGASPSTSFDCSGFVSWVIIIVAMAGMWDDKLLTGYVPVVLMFRRNRQSREI